MKSLYLTCIVFLFILVFPVNGQEANESALEAINLAESQIKEMLELGFTVNYANGTLEEAKLLFSQGKYTAAESLARYVEVIKQKAIEVDRLIDLVEERIYNATLIEEVTPAGKFIAPMQKLDLSPAQDLFNAAVEAFEIEDYDEAERLLNQAINKVDDIEKEAALAIALEKSKGFNLTDFLIKNWPYIMTSVIVISVLGFFLHRRIKITVLSNKIKDLEREKEVTEELIKKTQEKYFKLKDITKSEYDIAMERYSKSLIVVKKDIPVFEKRLVELKEKRSF